MTKNLKTVTLAFALLAVMVSVIHWIQFGKYDLLIECAVGTVILYFINETKQIRRTAKKLKVLNVINAINVFCDWGHDGERTSEYDVVKIFRKEMDIFIFIYFFPNGKMDICVEKRIDNKLEIFENRCDETPDFIIQTIQRYFK